MCAAVEEGLPARRGVVGQSVVDTRLGSLQESQALRLRQAHEQRQGFVGLAGWLVGWLNGTGPCCVRFRSHTSSQMRCGMSPCAYSPDQRWAPIDPPGCQAQIEQRT